MSTTLTQAERWLVLDTPLGQDVLVATYAKGVEGISTLFEFKIDALSKRPTIKPSDLLGKSVTLSMAQPGSERRYVNGIVTSLSGGAVTRSDFRLYTLTVSPALWVLKRKSDYKVFQEKSVVEIAEQVLAASEVKFDNKLKARYEKREYCVQFGETDLEFLERLFAEEGIFYYFKHEMGAHMLVLSDAASAYGDCRQAKVVYRQDREEMSDSISALNFGLSLTDSQWHIEDYDFQTPSQNIEGERKTNTSPASGKKWEQFRFPGGSLKSDTLNRVAAAAIDASDAGFESIDGRSTCASFTPGHRFTLTEHAVADLAGSAFVLTEVQHEVFDRAHFTIRPGMEGKPSYRNEFKGIPSTRIARAPLPAPRPLARGPQTAVVVGPKADEIHTDKYGRIRIQFHWDRYGKRDEKSSCFVRVAQSLAGSGWGTVFIPRVGMEVVVQFLDGDPDRPLVTGAVYNGSNMPPWALPANMTKTGLKSRSSKRGEAAHANELSFEDAKGSEKILFHAEKDFLREVENDDTLDVGHDQIRTIKNDRTTTITEGNEKLTIKAGNRTEKIESGNETLDIGKGNRKVTLGSGNDVLEIKTGNRDTTLASGNDTLTLSAGNHKTKAGGGTITLDALQGIVLKCGSNTIEVTQQGIKINGVQVTVQGTAKAEVKAPMVDVSGDGMLNLKGGLVKIN